MALLGLAGLATPAGARLAEAPELYFGTVSDSGAALPAGTRVSVRLAGKAAELDSYVLGSDPALVWGSELLYRLVVPIDAADPQADSTTRIGDVLEFLVDGGIAGQASVEAPGTAHTLDLDLANAPGVILWTAQSGCFVWALLGAAGVASSAEVELSWRLVNRCQSALARAEMRFRPGARVSAPAAGSPYEAPGGRSYTVSLLGGANGGIAFTPLSGSLAGGQSEQFTLRVTLADLTAATELWNTAEAADGSKGAVVVLWSQALVPGVNGVALSDAAACAEPNAPTGFSDVTVSWTVHPWSAARSFHLYRLEPGNPTAVRLDTEPLMAQSGDTVEFTDTLFYAVRALPSYRIEPLRADTLQPVAAEVVDVPLTVGCEAPPTPTVPPATPTPTVPIATPTPTLATPTVPPGSTPTSTPTPGAPSVPATPWPGSALALVLLLLAVAVAGWRRSATRDRAQRTFGAKALFGPGGPLASLAPLALLAGQVSGATVRRA